jgi:hypothetical protein
MPDNKLNGLTLLYVYYKNNTMTHLDLSHVLRILHHKLDKRLNLVFRKRLLYPGFTKPLKSTRLININPHIFNIVNNAGYITFNLFFILAAIIQYLLGALCYHQKSTNYDSFILSTLINYLNV